MGRPDRVIFIYCSPIRQGLRQLVAGDGARGLEQRVVEQVDRAGGRLLLRLALAEDTATQIPDHYTITGA